MPFVVGNRDYLVTDEPLDAFDRVHDGFVFVRFPAAPTLLLHGHGIDARDRGYARWHRLSRHPTVTRLLARLPSLAGLALAYTGVRVSRALPKRSEFYGLPMRDLHALAGHARLRGATRIVMGHYHEPAIVDEGCLVPVHIAPAWFRYRRILEAFGDGSLVERSMSDLVVTPNAR